MSKPQGGHMASSVQKLFEACKAAFGGRHPVSVEKLQLVSEALGKEQCRTEEEDHLILLFEL
jgi:hypothetical protein